MFLNITPSLDYKIYLLYWSLFSTAMIFLGVGYSYYISHRYISFLLQPINYEYSSYLSNIEDFCIAIIPDYKFIEQNAVKKVKEKYIY